MKSTDYLSTTRIGQMLQVSIATVNRWLDAGKIPFIKTAGGFKRVLASDLVEYMRKKSYSIPDELKFASEPVIFLIEHDASITKQVSNVIHASGLGCSLHTFDNIFIALTHLKQTHPSLIIFDILIPGINCIQLIKSLRANKATAAIKFIAITKNPEFRNNVGAQELDYFFNLNDDAAMFLAKISMFI